MGTQHGLLVGVALCIGFASIAQVQGPGFAAKLPVQDLPPGHIRDLALDINGRLWIGTENGLCAFDGVNLDLFRMVPGDTTSLANNMIFRILARPDGRLWVGGIGLHLFDPATGRFQRIPLYVGGERIDAYECDDMWMDEAGSLWVASISYGVLRLNPARQCLETLGTIPRSEGGKPIWSGSLCATEEGVWTTDKTDLVLQDPATGSYQMFPFEPATGRPPLGTLFATVRRFPADPDALWIGGWGLGLVRFDLPTRTYEGPFLWQTGEPTLTNLVFRIVPWGNEGLLLGTNDGIHYFHLGTRTFHEAISFRVAEDTERMTGVYALMQTANGQVWAGARQGVGLITPGPGRAPWLEGEESIIMAGNGAGRGLWAARFYRDRQLMRLDTAGQVERTWPFPGPEQEKIEPFEILETGPGALLIGTTHGLMRFRPGTDRIERMLRPGQRVGPDGTAFIVRLLQHVDGTVMVSTAGQGVWRWEPTTDSIRPVAPPPQLEGQTLYRGMALSSLDGDHLLMSFERTGIGVADLHTGTIRLLTAADTGAEGIEDVVTAVNIGRDVYVVMRTNGLLHLRWNGPMDGPPFTVVERLETGQRALLNDAMADSDGQIWIATTSGLLRFAPGSKAFVRWDRFNGFPLGLVDRLVRDGPQRLIAIGKGAVPFDPHHITLGPAMPGIYLRSLTVDGTARPLPPGGPAAPVELDHAHNTFTIGYAPIDLLHGDRVHFEVMLEGHDAAWADNGPARTVTYVGLPPGHYRFAVRPQGRPEAIAQLAITIVPAFWQTWWFKVAVAVASLLLVSFATRYVSRLHYRRRIAELEREQEVQRTRMHIARDIHDGIGGGLTRIAMLSRSIHGHGADEELAAQISRTSTELVRELGEIVWTVDPGNDNRSAFIAFVRNSLGRQFDGLNVELGLDAAVPREEGELPVPPAVKRNALLILKEAVNNALKHAGASRVHVRLHIADDHLELDVADDGQGFDPGDRAGTGHGLSNMLKRAQAAGGTLDMDARPGAGTTIRFRCPLSPTFM